MGSVAFSTLNNIRNNIGAFKKSALLRGHLLPLPSVVMSDDFLLGKLQKKDYILEPGNFLKREISLAVCS